MNKDLEWEKLQHIFDKLEKGESLEEDEEIYSDIIKALERKKKNNVEIDELFKSRLKRDLLAEYSQKYERARLINRLIEGFRFSFFRFAVSFCMIFAITFAGYVSVFDSSKLWRYDEAWFSSEENSKSSKSLEKPDISANDSLSSIPQSEYTEGISYWKDKFSDNLRLSAEASQDGNPILRLILLSAILSLWASFKRKEINNHNRR